MLKQYETVFIATPVLSDAQMKEAVAKYTGFITSNGGEIVYEEDWGLKQLAYPIQHKTSGFYYLIEKAAKKNAPAEAPVEETPVAEVEEVTEYDVEPVDSKEE